MRDIYTPRPGSLAARMIEFFQENPDEELSRADIAAKFVVASSSIDANLAAAIDFGAIKTQTGDDLQRVWVVGPNLKDCRTGTAPGKAAGGGQASRPVVRRSAPLTMPKPDELVITKGVPLPPATPRGGGPSFIGVFARMEVGDSFEVPADCAKRLMDYAGKWGRKDGRKFTHRRAADGGTARIWRTE